MFDSPFREGIIHRAVENKLVEIDLVNIRDFANDSHRTVDDYQFGGGSGMLMKPEPLFGAVESISNSENQHMPIILMSPQGRVLTQGIVEQLASVEKLVLICGRYEGVDERVRQHLATDEISIGDYVIGGGELAAMVLIEAVSRLKAGVVGSIESTQDDSFTTGLLQHPQYTRPAEFRNLKVPQVLRSGNHADIKEWRRRESLRRTFHRRPDLLESARLSDQDIVFLEGLSE